MVLIEREDVLALLNMHWMFLERQAKDEEIKAAANAATIQTCRHTASYIGDLSQAILQLQESTEPPPRPAEPDAAQDSPSVVEEAATE